MIKRLPFRYLPLAIVLMLAFVRIALGSAESDAWFGVPTALTNVILALTFIALIITQVYAVWNRQNHATRDETIKDLNALLAAREAVIAERERSIKEAAEKHEAQLNALTATCELEIKDLKSDIRRLKAQNTAITDVNLIAIAELTKLRELGLWKGHERDIFKQAGLVESSDRGRDASSID